MTQFGIPLRTATKPEEPEIDIETLIRLMVNMAMCETENRIMQKVRNLLADYDEQLLLKVERMIDNHVPLTTQTTQSTPTEQKRPLPDLANITRMRSQLFENFRKPKAKQIKNQAHVQLKLDIWVSAGTDPQQRINGYWLIPVHRPDRTEGRKRIKEIMPQVDELGRDQIKYAGKLGKTIAVYITQNDRLMMHYGDESIAFNPPQTKHADDDAIASVLRWDWDR